MERILVSACLLGEKVRGICVFSERQLTEAEACVIALETT